jgi:hypothetical protein
MCAKAAAPEPAFVQGERLPLFSRHVVERLSPTALGLLIGRAEVFVAGAAASGASARGAFLGSAMMTIHLGALGDRLCDPVTAELATRLCRALDDDADARARLVAHALEVARARLAAPPGLRAGELRLRSDGDRVLVDLELEYSQPRRAAR